MSKKMTPWFPPRIKPVRVGVYQIKFSYSRPGDMEMYATWSGRKWSNMSYSTTGLWHGIFKGAEQKKHWRGFTEEQDMTGWRKRQVMDMAREAGFVTLSINEDKWGPYLEAFAELVRADERELLAAESERNGNKILAMQLRARGDKHD